MDKRASEPSGNARPGRRPLTDFVTLPTTNPIVALPLTKKPLEPDADRDALPPNNEARVHTVAPRPEMTHQAASPTEPLWHEQSSGAAGSHGNWLGTATAVTSIAAKAAADYRSWLTEQMKSAVDGAFGYASGLVSLSLATGRNTAGRSAGSSEDATITSAATEDSAEDPAATACTRVFAAMSANWIAGLDYARRLAEVTSPADLILLSTSQARKQVDLLMEQSAALNALSRALVAAPTDAAKNAADKR